MRKLFFAFMALAAIALVGCKDKNEEPEVSEVANMDCSLPVNVEAVDLGLPSGTKWANMNVGATTPEGYGAYFAWGETSPKEVYDLSTYFDTEDGGSTFIKYNIDGGKTTLDLEDDAARVNWGGNWRMPTQAELNELMNTAYCTWTWITQNGVEGFKVTSKKKGYKDKSIFLPAAGIIEGTSPIASGPYGHYWLTSLYENNSGRANILRFYGEMHSYFFDRYYGLSVRPVCK